MKQSQFYYLLRRGLFKGASIVKEGLVMFNKFTTAGISHPAQGSAEFDGASDYIQLDTPFSYTNHTIAAWVYLPDTYAANYVFDQRDGNNDGFNMLVFQDKLFYQLNDSDVSNTISIENEWAHLVCQYNGTTQATYLNGSLLGSTSTSQTISTTPDRDWETSLSFN